MSKNKITKSAEVFMKLLETFHTFDNLSSSGETKATSTSMTLERNNLLTPKTWEQ